MKNVKKFLTIILLSLITNNVKTDTIETIKKIKNSVSNQQSNNEQQSRTKKSILPKEHIDFLIQLFTNEPQMAAAIKFSYINVTKILKAINNPSNDVKSKLEIYKKNILDPVKHYFPLLRAPIVSFIMDPLIINSVINETTLNDIRNKKKQLAINTENKPDDKEYDKITLQDIKTSIPNEKLPFGCKFLLAPEKEAEEFFYEKIKDTNDLIQICKEFFQIFGRIKDVLTPEIHKKANALIREMLQKQKNNK